MLPGRSQASKDAGIMVLRDEVAGFRRRLVTPGTCWSGPPADHTQVDSPDRPDRPPTSQDIDALVLRLARETPAWGYRRVHGELRRLGHRISDPAVRRILPARRRGPTRHNVDTSWRVLVYGELHLRSVLT